MTFILEFLPKKVSGALTIVVRSSNGFPIGTFDTIEEATLFIQNKYHEIMENENAGKSPVM